MYDPEQLISLYFNGNGALEQKHLDQLSEWIQQDPANAAKFVHASFLHRAIHDNLAGEDIQKNIITGMQDEFHDDSEVFWDDDSWQALAQDEQLAPVIQIEKTVSKVEGPKLAKTVKLERKISRLSIYSLVVSAAAVLFLMVLVLTNPVRPIVAVLTDSIDAEWGSEDEMPVKGEDLREGVLVLSKGLAEITFGNGAVVVIEAPAKFKLESSKSMYVSSGNISAFVSEYATGFIVNTHSASIVDLGTEFGVSVKSDGSCSLQMFKGKANLVAGREDQKKSSGIVNAKEAKSVDVRTGVVQDIDFSDNVHVRYIDSSSGLIWRGQDIDLVNIVSGGNGFHGTTSEYVIDPLTIKESFASHVDRECSNDYRPISWNSLIDGVFVPNGITPQTVSSLKHQFVQCPPTNGIYCSEVIFNPEIISGQQIFVNAQRYGEGHRSGLFMHANLGITFDLNVIRATYPGIEVKQFKSSVGNCDGAPDEGNADVWVLLDGHVQFEYTGLTKGSEEPILVDISSQDRFLTLITTDGRDKDDLASGMRASNSDWCVFEEPLLVLGQ